MGKPKNGYFRTRHGHYVAEPVAEGWEVTEDLFVTTSGDFMRSVGSYTIE